MSRSVVTFIKTRTSLRDFVQLLAENLSIQFGRDLTSESEVYQTRFLGFFLTVYQCEGFDDEGDLDFSNFDLVISIVDDTRRIPPEYRDQCTDAISIMLVYVPLAKTIDGFMITSDVQTLIMRG